VYQRFFAWLLVTLTACSFADGQSTLVLQAAKDNTIWDIQNGAYNSNGAGQHLFAGVNASANTRRALVAFDLSSIPAGSSINSATLQLTLSRTRAENEPTSLYRLLANWGEGSSNAPSAEGTGATAKPTDATWIHRFFDTDFWSSPGGDFTPTPTATTVIQGQNGPYTWTNAALAADVQAWLNTPASNFGWIVRGSESQIQSAMRFDSREHPTAVNRPQLTIIYTPPASMGACCLSEGMCQLVSPAQCATLGGTYGGNGSTCSPNPCPAPLTGACCLPTGQCLDVTAHECDTQGGTYQGNGMGCGMVSCPIVLEPFVDALPRLSIAQPATGAPGGAAHYEIEIVELQQQLHRDLPPTRVWGYGGSFPGPTIEARTGAPVSVVWRNNLRVFETQQPRTTHVLAVDTCLHGPDMNGSVPLTVTHLHGGHVGADSDGYPESAFPSGGESPTYAYPNIQQAGTLWYHDHAIGITRLNVYMGLAGFYLLRDDAEDALNLPRGEYEIPLAIQDRSFNPDGSLKYPEMWMDHVFGDFIVVNGKVWPYLNVNRGKYRFRLVNGSGSRAYRLSLSNAAAFWQIGTDLGLLPAPVPLTQLTITPGERADIIIDFAPYAPGTAIVLTNDAPAPFPSGDPAFAVPDVMKFVVQAAAGDTDPIPSTLAPYELIPESEAIIERPMILRQGMTNPNCPDHMGGMWMINDLKWDDITEFPRIGTTEIWSWINRSGTTHPMHMHLVGFQVLDRQAFQVVNDVVVPVGPRIPPAANELGWKDTVQSPPNQITRVIARFENFAGLFPYHCHILEHEDHEMMRQFEVLCDPPLVATQPMPTQTCLGATASLSAVATGDVPKFAWTFNDTALPNGPTPSGAIVSGADTSTITITGMTAAELGSYRFVVTSPCGTAVSEPTALTACVADTDCDQDTDSDDVVAFFTAWDQGEPGGDTDGDNDADSDDILTFFTAWDSGC